MMQQANAWMGGWASAAGMWLWTAIGVVVLVLVTAVIIRLSKK